MSKDVQCTVPVERAELLQQVFGTSTVYLEDAIGEMANLPGRGECHVYKLDLSEVTPQQKAKLASTLAARFGLPLTEVVTLMEEHGVPILAEDCVVSITGATARMLMTFEENHDETP